MVNFLLLAGRILFVVLLYIFLFAVMKTGIGLVKGLNKDARPWVLTIERGPKELRGKKYTVTSPLVVGRAPGSDIQIPSDIVSGRHARIQLMGNGILVEDLNSTNGTLVNDYPVNNPTNCKQGDKISIGDVVIKIGRK